MSEIPIADPDTGDAEVEAAAEAIKAGDLADGERVRTFERQFATFSDAAHGVATSNGTTALHAAFHALGIGEGDTVLTTPFSFVASANAARLAGAEVVFADIDPESYTLDPGAVADVLADRDVDAILAVHLYGLPAQMDRLQALANRHDCLLVEDAAQAHGAMYGGRRVGSLADAACFSFYPTKNMTTGEGGIILTGDESVAARAARFVNHGRTDDYEHAEVGHNFRMTSVAAAIGLAQLEKLPEYTARRHRNAELLTEGLADTRAVTPTQPPGRTHVYHQYTIRHPEREALKEHLRDRGVGAGVYYPTPIHEQPAYAAHDPDCPEAERAAEEVLSLPVHPGVTADDVEHIVSAVESFDATQSVEVEP
jgi:dTDP-4-amino-4,6-dideoxygalactose transaminase